MKLKKTMAFLLAFGTVCSICALGACSEGTQDQQGDLASGDEATAAVASAASEDSSLENLVANAKPDDPFVSDDICLSCHGGTYEAVAELTDAYGDSNPHAGAHGNGTMSCGTCHENGSEKPTDENNYCLNCHNWPREEQAYIEYMDL